MAAQRNFLKYGCMMVVILIVIVVGGIVAYSYLEKLRVAARFAALRKAIVIAVTPLTENPQIVSSDYSHQKAGLLEIYNNRELEFDNIEVTKAWTQITTDATMGLLALQRIGKIDNDDLSFPDFLSKGVQALQGDDQASRNAAATLTDMGAKVIDRESLKERFRRTEASLNNSMDGLIESATSLSHKEIPGALSVQYFPSWQGRFLADSLRIQNTSGSTLRDGAVFVKVHMKDGTSKVHVHYVNSWQNGSTLGALYPYSATDYASAQTGEEPTSVEVLVYLPSGTSRATYVLTPDEWDKIVASYCSRLTFNGKWLSPYIEAVTGKPYDSGFEFDFEGLQTLPVKSVEVRFTSPISGTVYGDMIFTFSPPYNVASGQPLRNAGLNSPPEEQDKGPGDGPPPPGHVEYIVNFSDANYQHVVHVY
jgi:hypothetical protein